MANDSQTPTTASAAKPLLLPALVVLSSFIAYWNALGNGFVYDDVPQVLQNPWIRESGHLGEIFGSNVWAFAGTQTNYYRPLMHVGYLVCRLVFGLNPLGFHLVNVLFHAANALLVFILCGALLSRDDAPPPRLAPAAAGVLFACHPVHTEVVAWVGGFTDLSYTFFCLGALYLLLKADRDDCGWPAGWRSFAAVCYFLATLCKEPAVLFPGVILAYDFFWNRRRYRGGDWLARYLPFAAAAAVYFVLRFNALGAFSPVSRHQELGFGGALLNALALFAKYLGKLLVPIRLNAWHVLHPVMSPAEPRFLVALAACGAFLAACVWAWRCDRLSLLALVVVALPLAPTLYVPAMGENPFAERYLYLPSAGFVLFAAFWLERLARWRTAGLRLAVALTAAVSLCYAAGAWARNPVWHDDVSFWTDTVRSSPEGAVPHYNLGTALAARGAWPEAVEQYRTAIAIQPAAVAYKSLGAALVALGQRDEAIRAYLDAIALDPSDPAARNELGTIYAEAGDFGRAIEQFEQAVRLAPDAADLRDNLEEARRRQAHAR